MVIPSPMAVAGARDLGTIQPARPGMGASRKAGYLEAPMPGPVTRSRACGELVMAVSPQSYPQTFTFAFTLG